ncbi:L-aspartate oxidase [Candidatus Peregrinibacteria bacterium]|jgi:L-aspartate oxidase|nr:L-aspartate oxidase [Candidatus Peregrinibacteria bacterium]MBT7736251.1 L-aspartate oxidase [Candidatus Peregrinibacteria bacterium]
MQTNFLVIGSGISGLNFALHAAKKGKVTLVTKKKIIDSNTNYAQGGIAAVLDKTDNAEAHIKDTLETGGFHNNKRAVRFMVENSADAIYRLIDLGVEFAKEKGNLKLTQEGGHNKRRIAYVGDYTGKEIERILVKRIKEHLNIEILEDTFALKLITKRKNCYGAQVIKDDKIENIFADQTIIATGGAGELYKNTTNPPIATGDGLAMAIEEGCKVKDLEFIQFHPTALAKKITPRFLISETVRGEGARLINSKGERFMKDRHPLKDLASRDIVAREIYKELKDGPVYIDSTNKKTPFLKKRFPQIHEKLKDYGYNMAKDLIPVTPAAHYLCGGITTDLHGKTRLKNLFAFGEVTCTGVHGANRLASNSLLEALVFSNQIAKQLKHQKTPKGLRPTKSRIAKSNSPLTKKAHNLKKEIQELMWQYAGIVRNRKLIKKEALPKIREILQELESIKSTNQVIAETKNMAMVAHLILKAAQKRRKSLGCHFVE